MLLGVSFSSAAILSLLSLLAALFLLRRYRRHRRFFKVGARLPGPTRLPLIGNALELHANTHRILYKVCELLDEHDGIAATWLGPKLTVLMSKPEYLEVYFTSTKMLDRSEHYRFIRPILGQGLFTSSGETWKKSRKVILPTFHPAILKEFIPVFTRQSQIMVEVLRSQIGQPPFDIFPYIRNCTVDMIFETAMSYDLGCQTRVIPEMEMIEPLMEIIYRRVFTAHQHLDWLFDLTPTGRRHAAAIHILREYMDNIIAIKKKEFSEQKIACPGEDESSDSHVRRSVFINQILERTDMTDEELRDQILTMVITGFDTTAGTLGFVLLTLGMHPEVQDKVLEEDQLILEQLGGRQLEAEDLARYQYLDRVIKETLRLFPAGPVMFRHLNEDTRFGEHIVPAGAAVGCVMLHTHRNPEIYENPLQFNPDNFLPENVEKRHPYAYVAFSAGVRGCVGVRYGMMSMKIILLHFLRRYRVVCDMTVEDVVLKAEITMKAQDGFTICLEDRMTTE